MYDWGKSYESLHFKEFILPVEHDNDCNTATWYYYNRLDSMGCGFSAFPKEMYDNISKAE